MLTDSRTEMEGSVPLSIMLHVLYAVWRHLLLGPQHRPGERAAGQSGIPLPAQATKQGGDPDRHTGPQLLSRRATTHTERLHHHQQVCGCMRILSLALVSGITLKPELIACTASAPVACVYEEMVDSA